MGRRRQFSIIFGATITGLTLGLATAPAHATPVADTPWGLDRIDQRKLPLDGTYNDQGQQGANVTVYVLDSGIRASHTSFGGRVEAGVNGVDLGTDTTDCVGHGTAVASVVGAQTYGVARAVTMVPIRLNECLASGPGGPNTGALVAGIDWMLQDRAKRSGPVVANISSVYGDNSGAVEKAVKKAIDAGVTVVVGAGNDNKDACTASPAKVPEAITVAGTELTGTGADQKDQIWLQGPTTGSNHGKCVDLFAPARDIRMASHANNDGEIKASGTSMAAPAVAGAAAAYLAAHPKAAPKDVADALVANATQGAISGDLKESPNRLLYVGTSCSCCMGSPSVT